jgi:ParB-like chromosome segregation protein Spo0J
MTRFTNGCVYKVKVACKCGTKTEENIKINPEYATLFSPLTDEEYRALKQSIKNKGYWSSHPIIFNERRVLLDGHHRNRACEELGIKATG